MDEYSYKINRKGFLKDKPTELILVVKSTKSKRYIWNIQIDKRDEDGKPKVVYAYSSVSGYSSVLSAVKCAASMLNKLGCTVSANHKKYE